jgi:hypothetical protein
LRNAPGNRVVIGNAHHEAAFALHQSSSHSFNYPL